ncbi:hypothetical protein BJ165DRAFT_266658 [Panaeolus papilionaceus]|nr:hypothetical protein BJ165DRAFT_266658 [Panaeolus papilionaceus]
MLSLGPLAYPHRNLAQLLTWLPPQRSKSTILWTTNLVACFQKPNPQSCFIYLGLWSGMTIHFRIRMPYGDTSIGNKDAYLWHDNILPHPMPRTTLYLTPIHPLPLVVHVSKVFIVPNHRPSVVHSHPTNGWTQDGVWMRMDMAGQRMLWFGNWKRRIV